MKPARHDCINLCGQFDPRKTITEWINFVDKCDDVTVVLLVAVALVQRKMIKLKRLKTWLLK